MYKIILFLLISYFCYGQSVVSNSGGGGGGSPATITFDAATDGTIDTDGNSSYSFSHTVADQSNKILIVGIACGHTVAARTVNSITYNSVSMTKIASVKDADPEWTDVSMWYLVAPANGSNTVTATLSGNTDEVCGGAISLYGVDQSTPTTANNSAGGSSSLTATVDVTSSSGEWVVDICGAFKELTVGAGQTLRLGCEGAANYEQGKMSTEGGASTTTMSWGLGASSTWALVAASFQPVQ